MAVKAHAFTGRIAGLTYCRNCGLVLLKNEATARATRLACPDDRWL